MDAEAAHPSGTHSTAPPPPPPPQPPPLQVITDRVRGCVCVEWSGLLFSIAYVGAEKEGKREE